MVTKVHLANTLIRLKLKTQLEWLAHLDLRVETSNICIALSWGFLKLHDGDHWVGVVREHSNHSVHLVVEQDRATRLQLILVDEREDGDVVLGADAGRDDCVVVVDDLLKVANGHGCSSQVVHL